jgi:hypothetical protein
MANILIPSRRSTTFDLGDPRRVGNRLLGSWIEYNGLVMNEHTKADAYIVRSIDASDADVRDSRDVNPVDHGETALDALYAGRTITLEGFIRAGNLTKLRNMENEMSIAFGRLVEAPLTFRYWDIDDDFSVDNMADYALMDGATTGMPEVWVGKLVPSVKAFRRIRHLLRDNYYDTRLQIDVITGEDIGVFAGQAVNLWCKGINSTDYLIADWDLSTKRLRLRKHVGSTFTELETSAPYAPTANTRYTFRFTVFGNEVVVEIRDPEQDDFAAPLASLSHDLGSLDADTFGDGISGMAGLATPDIPQFDWSYDNFSIRSLSPPDLEIMARKIDKLSMREEFQKANEYIKQFQVSLRASKTTWRGRTLMGSHVSTTTSAAPTGLSTTGRTYPRLYNKFYNVLLEGSPSSSPSSAVIPGLGNFPTGAIIRVFGQMTNPTIVNSANGRSLSLDGQIDDGEWVEIDSNEKTIVDSSGVARFDLLDFSSEWMLLEPNQDNELRLLVDGYDANAKMVVFWRPEWL